MKKILYTLLIFIVTSLSSCSFQAPKDTDESAVELLKAYSGTVLDTTEIIETNTGFIVSYSDEGFNPQYFNIDLGQEVTFINNATIPMWVASGPHPVHTDYPEFDALRDIMPGEQYSFVFDRGGTHGFHNHNKSLHNGIARVKDSDIDVKDISKTLPASIQIRDELLEIFDPEDANSIRELFERIRNDKLLANNCHDMAHDLGHRAYELYGLSTALTFQDLENVPINDIDDLCAGGYMHGVLEEYFLYNPEIINTPEQVCIGIPDENQGSCYHGVGHGVMFSVDRQLEKANEICRRIESFEPEHRCYEGVYMEYFWGDTGHAGGFLGWDIDDPLAVCSSAAFDEQAACYLYSHLGFLRTHKHDYNGAMNLCLDTKNIDDYGLSFCIKGIGITTMKSFERAGLENTELYTSRLNAQQKGYYYDGVIGYAFLSGKTHNEMSAVCEKMKTDTQACLKSLREYK